MAYTLTPTTKTDDIEEQEYGTNGSIWFTKFTSCIGIVAKITGREEVIGIHLVMVDDQDEPFAIGDVDTVMNVLRAANYDAHQVIVLGEISTWEKSNKAAYDALIGQLHPTETYPLGEGIYGATLDRGSIELQFK